MSQTRATPALAWIAGGVALGLVVAAAVVGAGADAQPWKLVLLPACWVVPGVLLAGGRSPNPLGWLMLGVGLMFAASAFATQWVDGGHQTGAAWAIWYADRGASALVPCMLAALLLLPDGRLPSPRWRPIAVSALAAQAALVLAWCLVDGPAASADGDWPLDPPNPIGLLPGDWAGPLDDVSTWVLQLPLLLGVAAVASRLRSPDADQRGRLVGVLAAAAVFALLVVLGRALWPGAADVLDVAGSALLAAALTSAVLRRRLHGVDVVVRHAFVYAVLTGLIGLGYVGVVAAVGGLGADLPDYGVGVVTATIAIALLPLHGHLQRLLERALYGDSRGAAIRRLTDSVGTAGNLDEVTAGLARAIAASLRAAYVLVEADGSIATVGAPTSGATRLPLTSGDRRVGAVTVGLGRGRRWRPRDRDLLGGARRPRRPRGARGPARRRAAHQPATAGQCPRGGEVPTASRPPRRARSDARRAGHAARRAAGAAHQRPQAPRPSGWRGWRARPGTPWTTYAGSAAGCDRRRSTSWVWSVRSRGPRRRPG